MDQLITSLGIMLGFTFLGLLIGISILSTKLREKIGNNPETKDIVTKTIFNILSLNGIFVISLFLIIFALLFSNPLAI